MPAQTRIFTIPTTPLTPLSIYEPTLTNDNLGLKTWGTALILATHLLPRLPAHLPHLFPPTNAPPSVLELGAGTGLLGLAAAALWGTEVMLTDLPAIVPNLARNAAANEGAIGERGGSASAEVLDWSSVGPGGGFDIVIAADPLYAPEHAGWLAEAIDGRLGGGEGARAVVGFPLRDETTRGFGEALKLGLGERGFELVREGEKEGFDDWEVNGERARVHCWWGIWARGEARAVEGV
jgi:methylase of polypeptide subunit release factors